MQHDAPPYSVPISHDRARELAQGGATLLLLDVPAGTVVGIDQQVRYSDRVSFDGQCMRHAQRPGR